jgi:transposase
MSIHEEENKDNKIPRKEYLTRGKRISAMVKARKIGKVQKLIKEELEVKPWSKEVQAQVYCYISCFFLSRS